MLVLDKNIFTNPDYLDSGSLNMAKKIVRSEKYEKLIDNEGHMEGSTIMYVKNPKHDLIMNDNLIGKQVFFNVILVLEGEIEVEWGEIQNLEEISEYDIINDQTEFKGPSKTQVIKEGQVAIIPLESAAKITKINSNKFVWMDCNKYTGMKALSGTALTI